MPTTLIKGLPLPPLLLALLERGAWRHPGDVFLGQVVPFLQEPVDFLLSVEEMELESRMQLAEDPGCSALFREVRGSAQAAPVMLPWLDADLAVIVAVNREPGADLAIALDYRTSVADPRVVASDWWSERNRCLWREAAPSFSAFVELLGLAHPRP